MLISDDVFYGLVRSGHYDDARLSLDAAADAEQLQTLAHRRGFLLTQEKRFEDALDHYSACKAIYDCKTLAHHQVAELLDLLGRGPEALTELGKAPFDEESDCFPILVKDAKFFQVFLRAKHGQRPEPSELDQFPADFATVLLQGRPFSKDDLSAMLSSADRTYGCGLDEY